MRSFLLLSSLLVLLAAACKQNPAGQAAVQSVAETTEQLPEGFMEFYDRFHKDSLFQIEHISWPLSGESSQADSTGLRATPVTWSREQWHMHHPVDFSSGGYKREFQSFDAFIIEHIRTTLGNYALERRFARRSDGSWELIYYSDMHSEGQ